MSDYRLLGAVELPTVKLIINAGMPDGRIAADPGVKLVAAVVEMAPTQKEMLVEREVDRLFHRSKSFEPVGVSFGQMMSGALDVFVAAPEAGLEIVGEARDCLYGVLFAIPQEVTAIEAEIRGLPRQKVSWLDQLPTALGFISGDAEGRFLRSMSLPHSLPFGHQAGALSGLVEHAIPMDELGIVAQGEVDGLGVVFARTALRADAAEKVSVDSIVGRLEDGSTVPCHGSIEWATFLKDEPLSPCVVHDVIRTPNGFEAHAGSSQMSVARVSGYRGPTTQVSDVEWKMALNFDSDVAPRISAVRIGQRWIERPAAAEGVPSSMLQSTPSGGRGATEQRAASKRSPEGRSRPDSEEADRPSVVIIVAFLADSVRYRVDVQDETVISRGVMMPADVSLRGSGVRLEMRRVEVPEVQRLDEKLVAASLSLHDDLKGHRDLFAAEPQQAIKRFLNGLLRSGLNASPESKVTMSVVEVSG